MVYFIYGEDSYRSKKKVEEIISEYKKVHSSGLNLLFIDAKDGEFPSMYQSFSTHSMFAEKKLAIITNLFSNKKFQEDFLKNIQELCSSKNIIIVYEQEKVDERTSLFKHLTKQATCQVCSFLLPMQLKNWVLLEFQKNKAKISDEALGMLLSYASNDLWHLSNEIKKLCNYAMGRVITKEDIISHIKPDIQNDIFKTIDAMVSSKNKKQVLSLFKKHISGGDNPLYLLSMIVYQFRNFLIIKDLSQQDLPYPTLVKRSKLHPFVVKKSMALCEQFSMEQLKKIYQKIFQIDADIKTGKIDSEIALDLLLAEI